MFLVLLELSAAFDTISHQHLIDLLASKFKIGGTVLSWIRSYLTDRSYRVKICSDLSEPICSNVGVPQGSFLGPILFNCVMASLPKLLNSIGIKSHMYADETQFWVSFGDNDELNNEATARRRIVQAFSIISNFMKSSNPKLNPSKTQFIPFSRKTNLSSFSPLQLDDQVYVSPATEVSNLGVLMDSKPDFHSHVSEMRQNCFHRLKRFLLSISYINLIIVINPTNCNHHLIMGELS